MKLTRLALSKIDNLNIRLAIAKQLQFSETWVRTLIIKNKTNGPLTTATAIQVIKKETGLTEKEILIESRVQAGAAK